MQFSRSVSPTHREHRLSILSPQTRPDTRDATPLFKRTQVQDEPTPVLVRTLSHPERADSNTEPPMILFFPWRPPSSEHHSNSDDFLFLEGFCQPRWLNYPTSASYVALCSSSLQRRTRLLSLCRQLQPPLPPTFFRSAVSESLSRWVCSSGSSPTSTPRPGPDPPTFPPLSGTMTTAPRTEILTNSSGSFCRWH